MRRLKHPMIENVFIEVDEERVAAHVAAGWQKVKETKSRSKSRKSTETSANKADETVSEESSPATDEAENTN